MTENTRQDLRIGWRVIAREKMSSGVAMAVLAIGICAVATQFSVVEGVFIRGFSFPNAERMMDVQLIDPARTTPFGSASQIFSLDYLEIRERQTSFERMAAHISGATVNMTVDGHASRYTGAYVTDEFFSVLGIQPALGRDFVPADNEPGAPKVAIIGHQLWQRDLGGDPGVLGRAVRLNGRPATIIGVMAPDFAFPINEEVWIPLFNEYPPVLRGEPDAPGNTVSVLALQGEDVDLVRANAEIATLAAGLAEAYPETNKAFGAALVQPLIDTFTPVQLRGVLWTMLGFCVGVLILACANVMNLQLARAALRTRELAIRSSLGATRWRLVRQMLTESALLATMGAVLGVAGAYWCTARLMEAAHEGGNPIPSYIVFRIDGGVLAVVAATAVFSALISGLVPAFTASRTDPVTTLKASGRGHTSRRIGLLNRGLVVSQIVITTVLLVGSFLQLQSILAQQEIDYGYDTEGVLSARLGLMEGSYPTAASKKEFFDRTLRELRADPEYAGVALTSRFQMIFSGNAPVEIEGTTYDDPRDRPNANFEMVSEGFFPVLDVPLLEGRDLAEDDTDQRLPVAVVNESFARRHFGSESAVGRRFRTVDRGGELFGPWRTIVGVVADVRMTGPFNNPNVDETGFYLPLHATVFGPVAEGPVAPQFATLVVRPPDGRRATTLAPELLADLAKIDPDLPPYFVATPAENLQRILGQNRLVATMFTIFGAVALLLAAAGLYSVMSFAVNQRRSEVGTRMALGANRRTILSMILRQGMAQAGLGLSVGIGLAWLGVHLGAEGLGQVLFEVDSADPAPFVTVAAFLLVVALVATVIPARRATRVDPVQALQAE